MAAFGYPTAVDTQLTKVGRQQLVTNRRRFANDRLQSLASL